MIQKRVCILTLGTGTGRLRASEVVQRALYDSNDPIEVKLVDAMDSARRWFQRLYMDPYRWVQRKAPRLWRLLFARSEQNRLPTTAHNWVSRRGWRDVLLQIKNYAPHLVVVTSVGAAEVAALGRREGWCNAPILAVQTDLQVEHHWVQAEIDAYCVATEDARSQLIGWGVLPNRVLLCGIPVDPAFALPFDKHELLQALGLDARKPVVLAMGGGMGQMPLDRVLSSLEHCNVAMQVMAVAGQDRALRHRLDLLRGRLAMELHLFGWTENLPELMAVSNLLITPPGGMVTAEALAAGLPMILTHPTPGAEERHLRSLSQKGVAVCAETLQEIPRLASRLLGSPEELRGIRHRAREWSRPDAAHAVAQVATALMEKATYIDLLATPPQRPGESAYLM